MRAYLRTLCAFMVLQAPVALATAALAQDKPVPPRHAMAMHGEPKYGPDFKNFDYVNPNAPKGGDVRLYAIGTFDSLNPFIIKGQPPTGIGFLFQTLLTGSADEPFTEYGLIAETMEVPDDRSWVIFNLRPQARFHDGSPITADDVTFSFTTLREKGAPFYRFYYNSVDKVEKLGERRVRFSFKPGDNRELPLIVGQMPVLSKKYWTGKDFAQTTLEPPVGSGPYKVESFEPGRFIRYVRVKDHWAKDLPTVRGYYNFETIRYDYYRDATVALEAFKAGEYDFRLENQAKNWATGYDFPAIQSGQVIKKQFEHDRPAGMQGFVFNTRRDIFKDARVRQALAYAFDFEWTNKNLFYGQYTRTKSYFANSDLASSGLPQGHELELLQPHRDKLPPEVFTKTYEPPVTDGSGNPRDNLRIAAQLLRQAGWTVQNGKLVNAQGKAFSFEILLDQPVWERISLPFVKNLEKLGIGATVRTVDTPQYKNRTDSFDFDMIVDVWGESNSPGNEQAEFWGSESAKEHGSRNSAGVSDPVVDDLVAKVIAAPDREKLVERTRALDRVLLWHHYVIPHWHIGYDRVAYWNKFGMPDRVPSQGIQFNAWWIAEKQSTQGAKPQPAGTGR